MAYVKINSGVIEATDRLDNVPVEQMDDDDIGKQMRAFHLMRDLMQVFNGPGCLENTPDGEEMRLPDAQTKPWLALGISRATWYRQGKPDSKGLLEHNRSRQNYWARFRECSTRTIQRWAFIRRYGIDELWRLAYHERLPCGMLEEIAKELSHEEQSRLINRLVELARPLPACKGWHSDLKDAIEQFGPVMGILFRADDREFKARR